MLISLKERLQKFQLSTKTKAGCMNQNTKPNYAPKLSIFRSVCFLLFLGTVSLSVRASNTDPHLFPELRIPPISVSGKVTDAKNAPLEGVSIFVKGTKKGVISDAQGNFTLKDVPDNARLVFTATGFLSKEVAVKSGEFISISLSESVSSLSDVVVIGYGTQKKKDLTGAVSQVKASSFENENPRSVQDLLSGNAPGLDVGYDPSTKGQSGSFQIRGRGSLTATTTPLIVLDGVIYPGTMADINPNDIATVDVLKDAS